MSGHKKSPIELLEDRVSDHINRTRTKMERLQRNSVRARKKLARDLEQKQQKRMNRLEHRLDRRTKDNLERLRNNFSRRLQDQSDSFQQALDERRNEYITRMNKVRDSLHKRINRQSEIFTEQLKKQRESLTDYVDQTRDQLQSALEKESRRLQGQIEEISSYLQRETEQDREICRKWDDRLENIIANIEDNYDHEKFCPGRLQEVRNSLQTTKGLIARNQYQAATARASSEYEKANKLLLELEMMTLEWEDSLKQARAELSSVKQFMADNQKVEIEMMTKSGQKHSKEVDVDFWTEGRLTELEAEIEEIEADLAAPEDMTREDILEIMSELDEIIYRVNEAVDEAVYRFKCYIQGLDMQEIIAGKLNEMGFQVEGNLLAEDDKRKGNVLLMRRKDEKILTRIDYNPDERQPEFNIKFNSPEKATREERLSTILAAINEELGADLAPENMEPEKGYEQKPAEEEEFELQKYRQKTV